MRENRMSGGVGGVTGNPRHLDPIVRPGFQPEKCPPAFERILDVLPSLPRR
jgi:hypothetical protein